MSSANIGKWSAQAAIDASGMQRGAQQAIQASKGMESALEGIFGRMGAALKFPGFSLGFESIGTAGAIQLVRSGFNMVKEAANEAESFGFLNDHLGTSVEFLSSFRTLAGEAGVGTEKFTAAMNRLNQSLGRAAQGDQGAIDMFGQLGLSAEDLVGGDTDVTIQRVLAGLAGIENRSIRARLATELFGREGGAQMLRLAMSGERFSASLEAIRASGGEMSSEQLENMLHLDRQFDRLGTQWERFQRFVTGEVGDWVGRLEARFGVVRPVPTAPTGATPQQQAIDQLEMDAEALRRLEERFGAQWQQTLGMFVMPQNIFEGVTGMTELANAATVLQQSMLTLAGGMPLTASQATANTTAFGQQTAALRLQIATMGMSAEAAQRFRNQIAGLTEAQLQEIDVLNSAAAARRAALAQQESAMNLTRQLATQARSPLEVMEERLRRIDSAGLNAEQRGRLFAAAIPSQASPLLGSMSAGGSEVASILQASMVPQRDIAADTLAVLEGMREDQERDREEMREIGRTISAFLKS